ncbi:Hok/Gef family protein [Escherichia coli]|nr:Hok/Gef family protein [Escherichia coli]EFG2026024.1 Hok/Gef family protein [Escherichia coli]
MKRPLVACLLIICFTILAFTLLTRQTLYELRFRDGEKEVAASWPARPGKGSTGSFPRVSGWQVHFLMAPLFTFQLVHVFFDALIEPSLQTNLPPAVQ